MCIILQCLFSLLNSEILITILGDLIGLYIQRLVLAWGFVRVASFDRIRGQSEFKSPPIIIKMRHSKYCVCKSKVMYTFNLLLLSNLAPYVANCMVFCNLIKMKFDKSLSLVDVLICVLSENILYNKPFL